MNNTRKGFKLTPTDKDKRIEELEKENAKLKELLKSIIDTPTHNQTGGEMYENKEYKELITKVEQFLKETQWI